MRTGGGGGWGKQNKKKKVDDTPSYAIVQKQLAELEYQMRKAAEHFDFEKAIALREAWFALQKDAVIVQKKE